ncbi:MAG: hypothetical protein WCG86_01010 [Actinomycetota bacterium]
MKPSWRQFMDGQRLSRDIDDIRDLAVQYVKEETLVPLKKLGRYVLFGSIGSALVSLGSLLLLLGLLRYLQSGIHVFTGHLSWIPYLIIFVVALLGLALTAWRITSGSQVRRRIER